eukprot:10386622-Heterocapsa_arctica.AAC.2
MLRLKHAVLFANDQEGLTESAEALAEVSKEGSPQPAWSQSGNPGPSAAVRPYQGCTEVHTTAWSRARARIAARGAQRPLC